MLRLFIRILIFVFVSDYVDAQQRICGNEIFWQDNVSKEKKKKTDDLLKKCLNSKSIEFRSPITIPVVVHVLWFDLSENIGDDAIIKQLEILNLAFSKSNPDITKVPEEFKSVTGTTKIRFCLASVTTENLPTSGIIRQRTNIKEIGLSDKIYNTKAGGSDAWDTDKYLNIWIANTGNLIAGFGTYPNQTPTEKTGVVIHPQFFGQNNHPKFGLGKTLVHEIGHYLGLYHLWGDDSDCATDDGVEDTPPQLKSYRGCPNYPQSGCSPSEMFMNYMDYVDDGCMTFFTKGQAERMLATINLFRPGLNNSEIGCNDLVITNKEIQIYPNPSNGHFQIKSNDMLTDDILVFNSIGQLMHPKVNKELESVIIDILDLPKGLYYVKVDKNFYKHIKID